MSQRQRIAEEPYALPPEASTHLAFERTRLAQDRTMLAWVRTATSLITFGFSIDKFFAERAQPGSQGPRLVGLLMIIIGLVSLLLAALQNHRDRKQLKVYVPSLGRSEAGYLAAFIGILGTVALVAVLVRF